MADNEIERMTVVLEAEYAKLLDDVKTGVNKAEREFDKLAQAPKASALSIGLITGAVTVLTQKLIEMASRGIQAMVSLGQKAIDLRSEFENAQITFTNMLGDKDTALAFLDQLKQKAIELKVGFGDATKFAKSILPDTSSLEQFNELLRLASIGAKDAKLPLEELIFAFNEAVSGDFVSIRDRLDIPKDVIARIKDADDKTGALVEELNKLFTKRGINDIAAFSDTLDTATANLTALGEKLLFVASESGFETLKESAQRFLSILQENEPGLEKIAKAVGDIANSVFEFVSSGFLDGLEEIDTENVLELADSTLRMVENVQLLAETLPGVSFDNLVTSADALVDKLNEALLTLVKLSGMVEAERAKAEGKAAALAEMGLPARSGGVPTELLLDADQRAAVEARGQKAYNDAILETFRSIDEATKKHEELRQARENDTSATDQQTDATDRINAALAKNAQAAADAAAANAEFADKGADYGAEIADLQAETQEKREELAEEHTERMAEIEEQYQERKQDIIEQRSEAIADLEEEIQERREKINKDTKDALADLEKDTQKAIEKEREDAQETEFRQTEDHQRDIAKLHNQYLFDLEDAVKNRDARAIVDLRRRFQKENRERTEDFSTGQRRRREDLDQRIDEIRENEREQRGEIKASQEEQLAELKKYEASKRADIQESYTKQMADLEENHADQVAAEMESYQERQAELDKALQKRLEAIAKELADEKDVTEEQAKALLEVLNATYGVGGDIDKMMEDFTARRRQKMTITVEVEKALGGDSDSSSPSSYQPAAGAGQGQGAHPGQIPGFQLGGIVPGPKGMPRLIMAHGGEEIVPVNEVARLNQMRQSMPGGGGEMRLVVEHRGSAPPGIRGAELDEMASMMVKAFQEAGLRVRR